MKASFWAHGRDGTPVVQDNDRRQSSRALTVYRLVRVSRAGEEGLARCRNISDTGMKLDVALPLSLNDGLVIEFAPDTVIPARVVWTNGNQCGVAFERSVDASHLLSRSADEKRDERARRPRLKSDIPACIEANGKVHRSTISNISQQGMMVTHRGDFHRGLHVKIVLDDGRERCGIVQWSKDNFAGLFLFDHFSVMELGDLHAIGHRPVTT